MTIDDKTLIAVCRTQFRTHGHLTLGRPQIERLFELAERGADFSYGTIPLTNGPQETVVIGHAGPPPDRRRRKVGGFDR
jgi:hypothetical protein